MPLLKLTLTNFRNHVDVQMRVTSEPVILTGMNGSGKTSILEAISLLLPGRGLCRAAPSEWQNHHHKEPWAVVADVEARGFTTQLATGRDPDSKNGERRVVLIDGQASKSQQALGDYVSMVWVTPEMDRVLCDGPSARRKLLDRMVYGFDPAHAGRIHRYEKAMRERLRLLSDGVMDNTWLAALEEEMARSSVAIAAARLPLLKQLQRFIEETQSAFPKADLMLSGFAEEGLAASPALSVEDNLKEALAHARHDDRQSGTCSYGAHRSDLHVVHRRHGCRADLCSTGEQKALLVAIMLAHTRLLAAQNGEVPLLLLDDITAHLDGPRRTALFEEILTLGVQAWLTGTDRAFFAEILPKAQHFNIDGSGVMPC